MTRPSPAARAEFVEGFALVLNDAGMQRMAARVFAALLAADGEGLTAKEIATTLDVSPAAVSGAVGYLTRTGLAARMRAPGARVDHFVVDGTTWAEVVAVETRRLRELADWLARGAASVPRSSAAVQRLSETRDFFEYLTSEMPRLVEKWHRQQRRQR